MSRAAVVRAGEVLFDEQRRFSAVVLADGSLKADSGEAGSIHRLGAILQGLPSCNGWTFWRRAGKGRRGASESIDELRRLFSPS